MRIPYIDKIRDEQIARLKRIREQKKQIIPSDNAEPIEEEKFNPVWTYEFRDSGRGYVDVYDGRTGEFMFSDDSSFAAKEFIRKNQRVCS